MKPSTPALCTAATSSRSGSRAPAADPGRSLAGQRDTLEEADGRRVPEGVRQVSVSSSPTAPLCGFAVTEPPGPGPDTPACGRSPAPACAARRELIGTVVALDTVVRETPSSAAREASVAGRRTCIDRPWSDRTVQNQLEKPGEACPPESTIAHVRGIFPVQLRGLVNTLPPSGPVDSLTTSLGRNTRL